MPYDRLYKVVLHNVNGTIAYEKEPFFNDKVNARRMKPYYWRNPPEEQQQQPEVMRDAMIMCRQPKWRPTATLNTYPFLIN